MRARALNKYVIDIREVVTHCELWKTVWVRPRTFTLVRRGNCLKYAYYTGWFSPNM